MFNKSALINNQRLPCRVLITEAGGCYRHGIAVWSLFLFLNLELIADGIKRVI
jgi:hypothetical protein